MNLYHPLTSDKKHFDIRVCILLPKSHGTLVTCKLKTLNLLEDKVDYEALSYAWGSSEDKATITVNETTLQVTRNLTDALTYLRHDSKLRSLWIDAICINQSDVDERNSQVRAMGRIYSSASCVISWLGLKDDPIDYVEQMKTARLFIELVRSYSTDELFALLLDSPSKEDLEKVFEDGLYSLQLVIGERKYRPPYWRRAWIIQEVSSARFWKLQSGALCISEGDIEVVMEILKDPSVKTVMKTKYQERRLRALIESVKAIIETSCSLDVLSYVNAADRTGSWDLPSWVPNWGTYITPDTADRPISYNQQRAMGESFRRTCSLGLLGHEVDDSFRELFDELPLESSDNKQALSSTVESLIKMFGYRYRTMALALANRSIFVVKPTNLGKIQLNYEIGIGEAAAVQESDLVCLLEGCGTPLILRPMGSQHVVSMMTELEDKVRREEGIVSRPESTLNNSSENTGQVTYQQPEEETTTQGQEDTSERRPRKDKDKRSPEN
ncbi:Heterokaryon incompatibility protein 6, OR allele [Fusarium oxysporum f. sp. cubense race 1]|uniref:Heterokaryon incompatibility protein 6, OR allele n=1 Tax=Fusarium oxysporum f. sp. cubense (strain race 1) TaxID=1229664 RepID=N4UHV8_FUSC1|nr:Heterokaryon incompatibility protein 6, OR allele [Fusarium oxysporum f. sp. cubense race 1]